VIENLALWEDRCTVSRLLKAGRMFPAHLRGRASGDSMRRTRRGGCSAGWVQRTSCLQRQDVGRLEDLERAMGMSTLHVPHCIEGCDSPMVLIASIRDGVLEKVGWCVGDGGAPPSLTRDTTFQLLLHHSITIFRWKTQGLSNR
jgi:hypothetical protein